MLVPSIHPGLTHGEKEIRHLKLLLQHGTHERCELAVRGWGLHIHQPLVQEQPSHRLQVAVTATSVVEASFAVLGSSGEIATELLKECQ